MIDYNENEDENDKQITFIQHKKNQVKTWLQIYEIQNVSKYGDVYVFMCFVCLTSEAEFMKNKKNTEAGLKKKLFKKKHEFQLT